jgi:hypothetical protein
MFDHVKDPYTRQRLLGPGQGQRGKARTVGVTLGRAPARDPFDPATEVSKGAADFARGPKGGEGMSKFEEVVQKLRERGLALPPDTTEENFLERLAGALHAVAHHEDHMAQQEAGEDLDDEYGEAPAGKEQRPVFMSTLTADDRRHGMPAKEIARLAANASRKTATVGKAGGATRDGLSAEEIRRLARSASPKV